jgi:hypothetical protein
MISFWDQDSKYGKLESLRHECRELAEKIQDLESKHNRLMAYYGLTEEEGPRIVEVNP